MDYSQNDKRSIKSKFSSNLYQLGEKIGEGGFGQVYQGTQTSTQQVVAIKFLTLNDDFDTDKKRRYIERFHRESDLIRRLNHPNIVRLIDKGEQNDSLLYAVYEYIDGYTLKQYIDTHGSLDAQEAADIMACVLDALSHAHDQGVIHRDIKPANIMLFKVGAKTHVKVLDFGIGTLKSEVRQLDYKSITLTQETLGTPSYSAPEQLRGEPPVTQTDIYVWGLVFLECLTGKPTITGSSLAAIFHQQLSPSNVPLGKLAGHSSANFFRRVLNKKSIDRPTDTAKLYLDFCQLNFSTLVGDLSVKSGFAHDKLSNQITRHISKQISLDHFADETLIHDERLSYSRLTERKQISVLSIILTTQLIQFSCESKQQTSDNDSNIIEQDVVDTFHSDQMQQCIDIAIRYGANHVGSLGDTLLFYFGFPQVTDNDSRLCSRAALDIISNVNKKNSLLKSSQGIISQVQMGIEIGLMLSLANNLPEGKAAHNAMKLSRQALPGQILCSENAKQMLENHLNFEVTTSEGLNESATITKAQKLYQLRGERQAEAFGFLRSTRKNSAFIGREHEASTLVNLLSKNDSDVIFDGVQVKNRLAHVHGEAGIGKSRLVFKLRESTPAMQHFVAQCLPEHQNNALYPILNLLKFKYSLDILSDEHSVRRLVQAIELTSLSIEHQQQGILVLAAWLNLDTDVENFEAQDKDYTRENSLSNLSPEIQKQRLFAVVSHLLCLENQVRIESNQNKQHLFIFEDLHWADPTSKEFIHYIVQTQEFTQGHHALVNTSREVLPELMEELSFSIIHVDKLDKKETQKFINYLFDQQTLAKRLIDLLIDRTDGIPLFIEEFASTLQSQKLVHKVNGIIDFVDNVKQSQVPATLRDSLQQRLDGLIFAKDTAQLAATIGRSFDYDLLIAVSDKDEAQIQMDLDELIKAELLYQQRQVDGDSYIFKHALVRDVVYESMTNVLRISAHNIIAKKIILLNPNYVEKKPQLLAHHYAGATLYDEAIIFAIKTVENQVKNSVHGEAIEQAKTALTWIEFIKDKNSKLTLELGIIEIMLPAVMTVWGYGDQKIIDLIDHVSSLLKLLPSRENQIHKRISDKNNWILFLSLHYRSMRLEARELGNKILCQAKKENNLEKEMDVLVHLAQAYMIDGDIEQSVIKYQRAIDVYESIEAKIVNYTIDVKTICIAHSSLCYLHLGQDKLALIRSKEAIEYSSEIESNGSITIAYIFRSLIAYFLQDMELVKATCLEYYNKFDKNKSNIWHSIFLDLIYESVSGKPKEAEEILSKMLATGQIFAFSWYVPIISDTYIEQGEFEESIRLLERCLELCIKNNLLSSIPFMQLNLAKAYYLQEKKTSKKVTSLLESALKMSSEQKAIFFKNKILLFLNEIE